MRRVVLTLALAALAITPAVADAQNARIPVQAGITVAPDTVRIGDPFLVTVIVRAPLGARVEFPEGPDSTATVQALDPRVVTTRPDPASVLESAVYRVAAWDVGEQPIVLPPIVVRLGDSSRTVSLAGRGVFVASVLPADSSLHVPKPARPLFQRWAIPWWAWLALVAALAAVAWLIWWWRQRGTTPVVRRMDPYEHAQREFARIEHLALVDAGERGRHVALMVDVLRAYLAARMPSVPLSLTSSEILTATQGAPTVPHERLMRVLNETDLVKFAQRPVTADRAHELGREARAIVDHEHQASMPAVPSAPATGERAA